MLSTFMTKVREARDEKQERKRASGYWTCCPACGKSVVKKEIEKRGCFACGWTGAAITAGETSAPSLSYKVPCPHCGRQVVRDAMERSGCYLCGHSPEG